MQGAEAATQASPADRVARLLFSPTGFAFLLLVLIVAAFPSVCLQGESFFYRDFGQLSYTSLAYNRDSFWRGEIPLWNPYNNCGIPYLAQWNTMVLYPFSVFCYVLPLAWSASIFGLLHIYLGGLGMYHLARRWNSSDFGGATAGIAYAFNGLVFSSVMWTNYLVAIGWLPWLVLLAQRWWRRGGRTWIPASLVGALIMLTGTPELTLLTWFFLLGTMLTDTASDSGAFWRQRVSRFGMLIVAVAFTSAVQLLPFLELLGQSQRHAGFGGDQWAMPATGWANLLVPLFYTFEWSQGVFFQYDQSAITSYYPGIIVIVLAALAALSSKSRRTRFLVLATGLGLLAALGDHGLIFHWLKEWFPSIGVMRYPIKLAFIILLTLPLLLATTVAAWEKAGPQARHRLAIQLLALTGLTLIAVALIGWFANSYPQFPPPYSRADLVTKNATSRALFLLGGSALLLLAFSPAAIRWRNASLVALLGLIWADALTHVPNQNPTVSREVLAESIDALKPDPRTTDQRLMPHPLAEKSLHELNTTNASSDVVFKRLGRYGNFNLLEHERKVHGSYALVIREMEDVNNLFYSSGSTLPPLADFLGATQASSPENPLQWAPRTNAMPLITAGQRPIFASANDTLKALQSPDFKPREIVYLPLSASRTVSFANRAIATIGNARIQTERVEFDVTADAPCLVVVAQAWYPAWRARVDEMPAELLHANHAFQALAVTGGKHHVVIVYDDEPFRLGAGLSVFALAIHLGVGLKGKRRLRSGRIVGYRMTEITVTSKTPP